MSRDDEIISLLKEIRDTQREAATRQRRIFRAWIIISVVFLPAAGIYLIWAMHTLSKP